MKWAATAGLLAGAAGLSTPAIAAWTAGVAAAGGVVWLGEMASLHYGFQLPHATLQHALCNELHTLAGGLLGAAPVAAALTALSAAMAAPNLAGDPEMGSNALAFITALVACPTLALHAAAVRSIAQDEETDVRKMIVYGLPLLAAGGLLVSPAIVLQAAISPEAAIRYVIAFGAGMACASVREGLTQATARAWRSLERNGIGLKYGLSRAEGMDRAASTILPTTASCLLFTLTTGLLVHQLDAWYGLGMAPAGQSVLTNSAGEAARRTALRYMLLQSTNELLEGIARCMPLAAYARMRDIPLRYHRGDGGMQDVPGQLRRNLANPETLRRAALFASARTADGALTNLLSQLSTALSPAVFWNDYRIAAILVQGATMARTPLIAAWLLPTEGEEPDTASCVTDLTGLPDTVIDESAQSDATASPQSDASMHWA